MPADTDAAQAFYVPEGDSFASTVLCRGPWDPGAQHGGPPCALLGTAMDAAGAIEGARITRATFELLKPVPIATLTTQAEVIRPGRNVELVQGTLSADGEPVIHARAWRIREHEVDLDGADLPEPPPMPGPDEGTDVGEHFFPTGHDEGYHTAMDARFLEGAFTEPGPARVWMRMRQPLIAGTEITPLQRVLCAADSGNGASGPLDFDRFIFINPDLSVALRRPPRGEWIGMDAISYVEPDGIGFSDTTLHDSDGVFGRGTQGLTIIPR